MKPLAISHGAPLVHCPGAPKTLPDCLYGAARQFPDRGIVYLQGHGSEEFQSYPTLLKEARQLLGGLKDAGIERGDRVIFQLDRNEDFIRAFWACIIGGFVPVPIGSALMPSSGAASRLRNAWKTLGHPIILTANTMIDSVRDCFNFHELTDLRVEAIDGLSKAECDPNAHHGESDDLAVLMLTSGSTGAAKAVKLSHANLLSRSCASIQMNGFSPRDVSLNWMLLDHVAGLIYFHLRDVYLGCQQVHVPTEVVLANPLKWLDLIEQYRATISFAPNFAYGLINDRAQELSRRHWDLSSMRVILNAGEAIVAKTARQFLEHLRPHGLSPHAMRPAWGMSETSSGITYADTFSLDNTTDEDSFVEVGRPIAGVSLRIVDEQNNLMEEKAIGSLQVKGLPVTAGYYGRPEADRETFTDDSWLKTGDLGFLRHGRLTITGREKDVIIINGVNYPSHEIESVVEEIAGVESSYTAACAVRNQDAQTDKLAVFFHPSSEKHWPLSQLLKDIRGSIVRKLGIGPDYLLPMEKQDIPKTSIGKIQRSQLAQRFQAGEFDLIVKRFASSEVFLDRRYVAPRTAVEEMLAEVWAEVLNLDKVGIDDNFFELGGHSLLAIQVTSRLWRVFQIELPLRRLFESPTVAGLAEEVEEARGKGVQAPPIVPASRTTDAPISFAQQRLWFLDQLEPNSSVYNLANGIRLKGRLSAVALEQSLNEIVRRHEALRTSFSMVEGQPIQVISSSCTLPLPLLDLSDLSEADREAEAQRLADEEGQRPFDLARGPLLRSKLVRLRDDDHVLLVTMHHIVSDGWSMGVFFGELSILYEAFSKGKPSPLPDLPIQYVDFTVWQRDWLKGEILDTQLSYWKKHLENIPTLPLPTDRRRPAVQSYRGAGQSLELSKALSDQLKTLSRQEGATLFMTLLAAFQTLLYRYSGQADIAVGSPIAGRTGTEIEGLIGFFVNTLVLRGDLSGNPTFRELLARVREVAIGAYAHQDVPFEKLVEELQPQRNLSYSPLFQVMFVFQNAPAIALEFQGLSMSPIISRSDTAKFDLTLSIREENKRLGVHLDYSTDLFNGSTIRRMLSHFENLLKGIVADPDRRLSDFPLLTDSERHQLLVEWNDTKRDYPEDKCVHHLFEEQVKRTPEAIAVVYESQEFSYRDLNQRANQLAHYLIRLGVGPEQLVGVFMERSPELVVAVLGILKTGGAYVALDHASPKERLAFFLQDAKTSILVTQQPLMEHLPSGAAHLLFLDPDWGTIRQEPIENPILRGTPANLAYVVYTSGSTGQPKGVMIEHRSLVNYLHWVNDCLLKDDIAVPMITEITFDACLKQLFAPLLCGKQVWLVPRDLVIQPAALLQEIRRKNVRIGLNCVPSLWAAILNEIDSFQAMTPAQGLTRLFLGGERLNEELVRKSLSALPDLEIWNLYGPTETTANASNGKVASSGQVTIGKPVSNAEIYLLDNQLQPVPAGVTGEVYIGGAGLARGYLNGPELTAEKFIASPFGALPGARLYRTGDLARYLPDGNIEFLSRIDHQIKLRGFRIEPREIESALSQHPSVCEGVVLARDDDLDEKRLVAYIVLNHGPSPSHDNLRSFLKQKLPEYTVPSAFVFLDQIPLTFNGKVDRRALPAPDQARPELIVTFVAPRTPVEELLAGIWVAVLKVEKVGVQDNFFELGGHSLLTTQVISRVHDTFGLNLPVRTLFENPTIEGLANMIQTGKAGDPDSPTAITPLPRQLYSVKQSG